MVKFEDNNFQTEQNFRTDESLEGNQVAGAIAQASVGGPFHPQNFANSRENKLMKGNPIHQGIRSTIGPYKPGGSGSAFKSTGKLGIVLSSIASISPISGQVIPGGMVPLNQVQGLPLNDVKALKPAQQKPVKKKTNSNSNKRTPAKKVSTRADYVPKYRGDAKNGDDDDDDDDDEDDDDDDDEDLALFEKKSSIKNSMSPSMPNKSPIKSNIDSSISPNLSKPSNTIEFQKIGSNPSSTPSQGMMNLKMKPMESVEDALKSTPGKLKFEEIKKPASALTSQNLIKFEAIQVKGENVKRDKKKDDDGSSDLDDITISDQNYETQDQMF